jgi:hypothetical protein
MADVRTLKLNLLADVDQFSKSLNKADGNAKTFSSKMKGYSKIAAGAFATVGAAAGIMAIKFGSDAIKSASDLNEEISKGTVIFGKSAKEIENFADSAATSLGLSKIQAMKATSTFAILGKKSGLTGKDLAGFSKKATTLAADLGSFYNTNADDAITAIGSALRGESEPIRKYGVLLDDATIKAQAMEMGLYDGKGALDKTAKAMATYQEILDQTTDAQGDFNRTSDGIAGQQKIFNAAMDNIKVTFGETLLPILTNLVSYANDTLLPLLKNVADGFAGKPNSISNKVQKVADEMGYGNQNAGYTLGQSLSSVADSLTKLFTVMVSGDAEGGVSTMESLANALERVADGIDAIARNWNKIKGFLEFGFNSSALGMFLNKGPKIPGKAVGGSVKAGQAYRVGEFGPETFIPAGSGSIRSASSMGGNTVININGIVDAASARRSIERLLQTQSRISGPINLAGAMP